jgi:coiled-coil and C2 domain-containing protein 2A
VWANKQLTDKPWEMSWDLSDAKCWRPFFEKATTNPMPTPQEWTVKPGLQPLQKKTLQYRKMTEDYRNDLEREVEDRLQREFEDLRGHRPTDWNRSLANTLKKLLRRFEDDAAGTLPLTKEEHEAELSRIRTTYSPVGFPIHAKLTEGASLKPLIEKLRNTNLWISDSPKIQFALSAYVHPYPNNLASVWVYVAALHDQRSANIGP